MLRSPWKGMPVRDGKIDLRSNTRHKFAMRLYAMRSCWDLMQQTATKIGLFRGGHAFCVRNGIRTGQRARTGKRTCGKALRAIASRLCRSQFFRAKNVIDVVDQSLCGQVDK